MCDDLKPPEDGLLKLYGMLTDQLHKNSTLLWQIPTALFAANAFALDKFIIHPLLILFLSLFDLAMAHACSRVFASQRAIISATRSVEDELRNTSYKKFTPDFKASRVSAPGLIVKLLFFMTVALFLYGCYLLTAGSFAGLP